jgi:hypothetical protein
MVRVTEQAGRLEGWKAGRLEGWKAGRLEGRQYDRLAGRIAVWQYGRQVG